MPGRPRRRRLRVWPAAGPPLRFNLEYRQGVTTKDTMRDVHGLADGEIALGNQIAQCARDAVPRQTQVPVNRLGHDTVASEGEQFVCGYGREELLEELPRGLRVDDPGPAEV